MFTNKDRINKVKRLLGLTTNEDEALDDEIYFDMTNKKEVRKKIDDIINISYELRGIIKNQKGTNE